MNINDLAPGSYQPVTPPPQPQAPASNGGQLNINNLAPGSYTPVAQNPSVGGFIGNIGSSAYNLGKNVVQAGVNVFNPNPQQNTVVNLGSTLIGAGESAANAALGTHIDNQQLDTWNNVANFFKNRYGSPQALVNTVYSDPAGFAADLSAILGGAGAVAGKLGDLTDIARGTEALNAGQNLADVSALQGASTASKIGKVASTAAEAVNPFVIGGKLVTGAAKLGGEALARSAGVLTRGGAAGARMALEGNPEFEAAASGAVSPEDVVGLAKSGLQKITQERGATYRSQLSNIGGESTPPVPVTPEMTTAVQSMIDNAKPAYQYVNKVATDLVDQFPGTEVHSPPPGFEVKGLPRALEKVSTEYGGDLNKLQDLARTSIVVPDEETAMKMLDTLKQNEEMVGEPKLNMTENKNGGYRNIRAVIKTPNGIPAEIQFTTPNLLEAKLGSIQALYTKWRSLPDESPQKYELGQQMETAYNKAFIEDKTLAGVSGASQQYATELKDLTDSIKTNGGVTYDYVRGNDLGGTPNYSVSMFPERSRVLDALTPEDIGDYIDANKDLLSQRGLSFGAWYDNESGKYYLDVSATTPDLDTAKELGTRYNQKAIFDLQNFKEISTGGTGEDIGKFGSVNDRVAQVGKMSGEPVVGGGIDIKPIQAMVPDLLKKFRITTGDDGTLDFSDATIAEKGHADIKEAVKVLNNWSDNTPLGLDALKRRLGDLIPQTGESRAFITPLRTAVSDLLKKEVPGYDEMVSSYRQTSQLLKEFKSLSLGGQAQTQTILNKLMKVASTDDDFRKGLLAALKQTTGRDIEALAAGLKYQSWKPAGLIGTMEEFGTLVHPAVWWTMLTSSPRFVSKFLTALGWTGRGAANFMSAIKAAQVGVGLNVAGEATQEAQQQKTPAIPVRVPATLMRSATQSI